MRKYFLLLNSSEIFFIDTVFLFVESSYLFQELDGESMIRYNCLPVGLIIRSPQQRPALTVCSR